MRRIRFAWKRESERIDPRGKALAACVPSRSMPSNLRRRARDRRRSQKRKPAWTGDRHTRALQPSTSLRSGDRENPLPPAPEVVGAPERYRGATVMQRSPHPSTGVRSIGADDWRLWRELRLEALREAPYAFSSTLADWQGDGDTEQRWRARLTSVPFNVVAYFDDAAAGIVSGTAPDAENTVELISMWVAPFGGDGMGPGRASRQRRLGRRRQQRSRGDALRAPRFHPCGPDRLHGRRNRLGESHGARPSNDPVTRSTRPACGEPIARRPLPFRSACAVRRRHPRVRDRTVFSASVRR